MSLFLPVLKCGYMERQHLSPETRAPLKGILGVLDHTGFRLEVLNCQKLTVLVLKA